MVEPWIDSTVYLTNKLPEYITKSDLFAFQDSFGLIRNPALMSVWLLHSTPHNEVIRKPEMWHLSIGKIKAMWLSICCPILF